MGNPVKFALIAASLAYAVGTFASNMYANGSGASANTPRVQPVSPATSGPVRTTLTADSRGHFIAQVTLDGSFVSALVDTGASMVAISAEDAQKAGIHPLQGAPQRIATTANGPVSYSVARIRELRLNGLVARDVEAAIMPKGALQGTLLGMSFLNKLSKVEMGKGTLTLVQ